MSLALSARLGAYEILSALGAGHRDRIVQLRSQVGTNLSRRTRPFSNR
jgi:hypothetical protein